MRHVWMSVDSVEVVREACPAAGGLSVGQYLVAVAEHGVSDAEAVAGIMGVVVVVGRLG